MRRLVFVCLTIVVVVLVVCDLVADLLLAGTRYHDGWDYYATLFLVVWAAAALTSWYDK